MLQILVGVVKVSYMIGRFINSVPGSIDTSRHLNYKKSFERRLNEKEKE